MKTLKDVFHDAAKLLADRSRRCTGYYRRHTDSLPRFDWDDDPPDCQYCLIGALGRASGLDVPSMRATDPVFAEWAKALGIPFLDIPEGSLLTAWDDATPEQQDALVAKMAAYDELE